MEPIVAWRSVDHFDIPSVSGVSELLSATGFTHFFCFVSSSLDDPTWLTLLMFCGLKPPPSQVFRCSSGQCIPTLDPIQSPASPACPDVISDNAKTGKSVQKPLFGGCGWRNLPWIVGSKVKNIFFSKYQWNWRVPWTTKTRQSSCLCWFLWGDFPEYHWPTTWPTKTKPPSEMVVKLGEITKNRPIFEIWDLADFPSMYLHT